MAAPRAEQPKAEAKPAAPAVVPAAPAPSKVDPRKPTGRRVYVGLEEVGKGRFWVVKTELSADGKVLDEERVGVCPDTIGFQSALLNQAAGGLVQAIFTKGWSVV